MDVDTTMDTQDLMRRCDALVAAQRPGEAEALVAQAIASRPRDVRLRFLEGNLRLRLRRLDAALESYETLLRIDPSVPEAHNNRAATLRALGHRTDALSACDQALRLCPDFARAHCTRGSILVDLGRAAAAVESFDRAIRLRPQLVEAHLGRGNALMALRRFDEALAAYEHCAQVAPTLAEGWYNAGNAAKALGRFHDALENYDRALERNGRYAEAHCNRAQVLVELLRFIEAKKGYRKAIAIAPRLFDAHYNLGNLYRILGEIPDAIASFDRALEINSASVEAHNNRGVACKERGDWKGALSSFERAISIRSDFASSQVNAAMTQLSLGNFSAGWPGYEYRLKDPAISAFTDRRVLERPLWLGREGISGQTLLLHAEQGLGDTLQFCRYAKRVAALGAKVVLEVQGPLVGLLQGLEGTTQVIGRGDPLPPFDRHCPLLSLPLAFQTTLETIPAEVRYLRADASKVSAWRGRLGGGGQPRVGLVWSGNPRHKNDRHRSIALHEFVAHLPEGIEYVSLQRDVRAADRETLAAHPEILDVGGELADFTDTAALCECLDLVISVDTSVAHLSAGLGRPTWILLPFNADWRWLLERRDSPWYPTVQLYRQTSRNEWNTVLTALAAALKLQQVTRRL
jgi:tetratricopeptide (TPR) repeat protein